MAVAGAGAEIMVEFGAGAEKKEKKFASATLFSIILINFIRRSLKKNYNNIVTSCFGI